MIWYMPCRSKLIFTIEFIVVLFAHKNLIKIKKYFSSTPKKKFDSFKSIEYALCPVIFPTQEIITALSTNCPTPRCSFLDYGLGVESWTMGARKQDIHSSIEFTNKSYLCLYRCFCPPFPFAVSYSNHGKTWPNFYFL